ncbi:MAG: LacI family DNA-binding transcriptional regulator [Gaiellales bacterium]
MTPPSVGRKRATLRDVAEATGLSVSGAHYALRGERVSADTALRAREAAERIGFRSDPIARALRSGTTGVVGVVGGSLHDYWHQQFASELGRHLRDAGRHMLLADANGDHDAQLELAESLVDQRVDGLVVLPVDPASPRWRPVVAAVPTVSVGPALPAPAASIRFDAQRGIRVVLAHLRGLGHRRVLVLTPGVHGLPPRAGLEVVECGFATEEATRATRERLTGRCPPTAVFGLSDALAYGALAACRELGRRVPADVSVAGFDDHPLSALVEPGLTTVSWDTPRAAAAAAELLGAGPRQVMLPPALVERASTGPSPVHVVA